MHKTEPLIDKMQLSFQGGPTSLQGSRIQDIQTYAQGILAPLGLIPVCTLQKANTCGQLFLTQVPPPSCTHTGDFAVDLGGILALRVRILRGGHLQDAHSKGVDIHGFVVLLLVHLWGHELRCSCQGSEGTGLSQGC